MAIGPSSVTELALRAPARRTTSGPVNAAQGVWDDVVDWFNGLEFNENGILLGFAVLDRHQCRQVDDLQDLLAADRWARQEAESMMTRAAVAGT